MQLARQPLAFLHHRCDLSLLHQPGALDRAADLVGDRHKQGDILDRVIQDRAVEQAEQPNTWPLARIGAPMKAR